MTGALLSLGGWAMALVAAGVVLGLLRERAQRLETVVRAAHELRGPLHAIGLGVALECGRETGRVEQWRAVELELDRARLALDDLLAGRDRRPRRRAWRSPQPTASGHLERLSARRLLEEAVCTATPRALAAGVELIAEWVGEDSAIWGSRVRIAQALGNLLANAVEHGGGPISLRARGVGQTVRFEVSDHGAGLPAPVADLTRGARAGRGRRGRGLAIADAIAVAHGGRLSAALAHTGARLVLDLPAWGSGAASAGSEPPRHGSTPLGAPQTARISSGAVVPWANGGADAAGPLLRGLWTERRHGGRRGAGPPTFRARDGTESRADAEPSGRPVGDLRALL